MALSFQTIRPLFQTGSSASSRWLSYIGLGIGVLLLLCSAQMFVNIQQLLQRSNVQKSGYDFISITRTVTNATMGQPDKNLFHAKEIDEVRQQPFVQGVAPLLANRYRVQMSAGSMIPLRIDLFLESLEHEFIDTLPPSFAWTPGQEQVPLIVSSDFLEAYNVFAPGQGLPQLSSETVTSIPLLLTCSGRGQQLQFYARIVAFSDRINSVLVPKTFLDWSNNAIGEGPDEGSARLFVKTKDANEPKLLTFLDQRGYKVNSDKTKFGRTKGVLQGIFTGLGIFGLLVVVLALMLFSFYLQLVIARSRESLQLLLTLGYSPAWLSRKVSNRFVPVYVGIVLTTVAATQAVQWAFHKLAMYNRPELNTAVHWSVPALALLLIGVSVLTNYRLVRSLIAKLGA
ncbi:MAG: hypothetical protein EOO11_14410 [Chitinophagaceae bacterium]|nr:MAG: hypothetical protein EOO11_14410 [Chitinophagaceae bacterium]